MLSHESTKTSSVVWNSSRSKQQAVAVQKLGGSTSFKPRNLLKKAYWRYWNLPPYVKVEKSFVWVILLL